MKKEDIHIGVKYVIQGPNDVEPFIGTVTKLLDITSKNQRIYEVNGDNEARTADHFIKRTKDHKDTSTNRNWPELSEKLLGELYDVSRHCSTFHDFKIKALRILQEDDKPVEGKPLPCPWCKETELGDEKITRGYFYGMRVTCKCGVCGPWAFKKKGQPYEEAIAAWNRRAK